MNNKYLCVNCNCLFSFEGFYAKDHSCIEVDGLLPLCEVQVQTPDENENKTESSLCEIKNESSFCERESESNCCKSKIEPGNCHKSSCSERADEKPSLISVLRDAVKNKKSKMRSGSESEAKEALLASSTLSRYEASPSSSEAIDKEISEAWKLYMEWKKEPSLKNTEIPRFYFKVPFEEGSLRQKLREEARAVFIERKNRELLDNEDLRHLWVCLEKNKTPPFTSDEHKINYQDYMKVADKLDKKFRLYFSARIFAKLLQSDPFGRISVRHFFNYVMRKVWLHQTRIGLSLYDVDGQGYLREVDLENYILELIPTLPQLDGLEASFHSFYVCTAVRKFFFFLDPFRMNKVRIQDILACSFLDDLLELRDETLPKDVQDSNWFSAPSALRVYGQYLNLDTDHNGMLSKQELARYGTGTLTSVFIERVFQECLTYDREMDYKTYLDFVLALENRKEPQSLQYFFRLLDIQQRNYLTVFEFNYFFRAIQDQLKALDQELVLFEDVKDEIFDMIKPEDPLRVTLNDLIVCGQGDTVVSILIDLNGFWTYENREVFVADNNEEAEV